MPITRTEWTNKDGTVTRGYRADAGRDPVTGQRRRKRFAKWGDADRWLKEVAADAAARQCDGAAGVASGRMSASADRAAASGITLRALGAKHVNDRKAAGRERGTWQKYEEHFAAHLCVVALSDGDFKGRTLADVPIARLRPRHLMQLKADLVATRSHAMALKVWSTLNAAMDLAVAMEWLEVNPATAVKIDRKPRLTGATTIVIPSKPEIAQLYDALQPRMGEPVTFGQAFVLTMLSSGLRPGEMRGLRWPALAIDAAPFQVKVIERADSWNQVGAPKSAAGFREVPLPASTAKLLREWRLACPKSAERNLVFPTAEGHYQHPANLLNRIWAPLQIAIGLKEPVLVDAHGNVIVPGAGGLAGGAGAGPASLHQARDPEGRPRWTHRYPMYALRHAYASIQIELGIEPKLLQSRMGHASIQVTLDTYGHLWRDHGRDAAHMTAIESWFAGLPRQA